MGRIREYSGLYVESSRSVGTGRKRNTVWIVDRRKAEPKSHENFWDSGLHTFPETVCKETRRGVEEVDSRRLPGKLIKLQTERQRNKSCVCQRWFYRRNKQWYEVMSKGTKKSNRRQSAMHRYRSDSWTGTSVWTTGTTRTCEHPASNKVWVESDWIPSINVTSGSGGGTQLVEMAGSDKKKNAMHRKGMKRGRLYRKYRAKRLDSKCVFKILSGADGGVHRFKVCLCARGCL